ncbi:MAG: GTPase HflX [Deltaproteobacteria bacterium]|nr:GTPase HflX [Deltaproteobacteria bacterium]
MLPAFSNPAEKAFLIGTYVNRHRKGEALGSLEELAHLARSAGASVIDKLSFELRQPSPATLIGEGRVEGLKPVFEEHRVDLVIFDQELNPTQNRNLEEAWGRKVIDRTGLILDIFARRARTKEGKIQVEMAQLSYLLPRLVGKGITLSRLAGGIGTRGPGETKLEIDRRRAREKIHRLSLELKKIRGHRGIHRGKREKVPIPLVALVGYTNAGKSTLMNRLTQAGVFVEDKLFATLDPTVRRLKLPSGRQVLLSDTVGFIRNLPHELILSFRATFEEAAVADLLLHVVDFSSPVWEGQQGTVEEVLEDFRLSKKPLLTVYNKIDLVSEREPPQEGVAVSAEQGTGLDRLLKVIEDRLSEGMTTTSFFFPHSAGRLLALLYKNGRILSVKHLKAGIRVKAAVGEKQFKQLALYRD